jgi:hypothetical protein
MWRGRLHALLILGVAVTASSFVAAPTGHARAMQPQSFAAASRTSSQLFIFEGILDALTGRSDNNGNSKNKRERRRTYYDDDFEPIKRYRGEPGLGGTSSPYFGPMPYGYARGNTGTPVRVPTSNFVEGGDAYYPRQERMNEGFAAYGRTEGTILPQELTSSTLTGTSSMANGLGIPATARGIGNFPYNGTNNSTRSSSAASTATNTRQTKTNNEEPNKFVPGGEGYYRELTSEEKKSRATATSNRRVNGDFSDFFTSIDPSSFTAGTKDHMAIQLKQALDQVKMLEEDNKMLVRELRVARGVEEDLVKETQRLELELSHARKQLIQLQNRCKTTDHERQDLTQKLNLYVQERDATRVNYEDNLDLNNRLAQAERRLKLTGIYINEE